MNLKERFLRSKFTKGVALISGGTAFAQIINIIISPIITRLYTPEEYGILTMYTAFLSILAIAGALKYEWGIPISKSDIEAINVLTLSILTISIISSIIYLIFKIWSESILIFFDAAILANYWKLIPIGVFLSGIYTVFSQWALRKKNFRDISSTKIAQSIFQNLSKVGLGLIGLGPIGLIVGRILGQSAGILTYIKSFMRDDYYLIKEIKYIKIKKAATRYKNFPLYGAPGQVLNSIGIQLPVLLITSLYGSDVVGYYGLAMTIVSLPMNLIGLSVADVFYSEIASIGRQDSIRIKSLVYSLTKKLVLIGLLPLSILLLMGPNLFTLVFGSGWREAGVYAQIIAILVFARFVFTPFTRILNVYEKQFQALILDILRVIIVFATFYGVNYLSFSSYQAILAYTISMTIVYILTYLVVIKVLDKEIIDSRG
ncbi:MAG: oligosaccharide flippase family protein [Gudongella sp.]|nr:oligosaccharide flippase family protein [Gudongella sp.]